MLCGGWLLFSVCLFVIFFFFCCFVLVSNVSVAPVCPPRPSPVLSLVEFPQGGAGWRDPRGQGFVGKHKAELS